MAPPLATRSWVLFAAVVLAGGCFQRPDRGTDTYVTGLRVLAVKASPPEVAAGQTTTLTALAVDTTGRMVSVDWTYCQDPPPIGSRFNTDCVSNDTASYITPFGSGLSAMLVMPTVDPAVLGSADQTGGVYLPIRAKVTAGTDSLNVVYHLRVNQGSPPNHNPTISGIYQVMASTASPVDGGCGEDIGGGAGSCMLGSNTLTSVDPTIPLGVHFGDKLTLRALFTADSAEMYTSPGRPSGDGGVSMPRMSTERPDVSWFTTGGTITDNGPGSMSSDLILTIDSNLPATGGTIDVWAVGRDNRGGTDYQHRVLALQ